MPQRVHPPASARFRVRVSELADIDLEEVNLAEGHIKIRRAKGGKERMVPIGSLVQRSLWKYVNNFRPPPLTRSISRLFLNASGLPLTKNGIQQMVRWLGKRASISGVRCSPHTFRHTLAKNYVLNGGDIFSLQKIVGHSSLASVRMYLSLSATDIERQHQRFSPLNGGIGNSYHASKLPFSKRGGWLTSLSHYINILI